MKKLFILALAAIMITACGSNTSSIETTTTCDSCVTEDSVALEPIDSLLVIELDTNTISE